MGKGKVKPFQALKGQPNFTSCSKYSKIVCSMNLPREGDVVNSYLVVIVGYALFLILLGYGIGKHVKGASDFFVGGRSFSWKLLFTTLIAANIGAGSTVGVAEGVSETAEALDSATAARRSHSLCISTHFGIA